MRKRTDRCAMHQPEMSEGDWGEDRMERHGQRTGVTERTTVWGRGIGRTGCIVDVWLAVVGRSIVRVGQRCVRVHDDRSFLCVGHGDCRCYEWSAGVDVDVDRSKRTGARPGDKGGSKCKDERGEKGRVVSWLRSL